MNNFPVFPSNTQPAVPQSTADQQAGLASVPAVTIPLAPAAAPAPSAAALQLPVPDPIPLSDGRIAVMRRPTGEDFRAAMRIGAQEESGMVMACMVSTINGVGYLYEEFLKMDLSDIYKLVNAYNSMVGN